MREAALVRVRAVQVFSAGQYRRSRENHRGESRTRACGRVRTGESYRGRHAFRPHRACPSARHPPLLFAAEMEKRTVFDSKTEGTDWTIYGPLDGCCGTSAEAFIRRRMVEATCRDTVFRSVRGSVARGGREVRPVPQSAVGVIPFGVDAYRGTLVTGAGERLSIVWERQWLGNPGDREGSDPLDAGAHTFDLRRLAGARHWTATNWSGRLDGSPTSTYADRAGCIAYLTKYDA